MFRKSVKIINSKDQRLRHNIVVRYLNYLKINIKKSIISMNNNIISSNHLKSNVAKKNQIY